MKSALVSTVCPRAKVVCEVLVVIWMHTQPPTVACKMEAQSEYVHIAHTFFFCTFGADLYAQSVIIHKISASELSRRFIKSALLVG